MKNIITTFLVFCIFSFAKGEVTYLKIDDSFVEFGMYDENNRKTKIQKFKKEDEGQILDLFHNKTEHKILYYIHSLHGNFQPYHRNSIKQLKQIKGFDKIVCIEWKAKKIRYMKTWEYAGEQGEQIGGLMNLLFSKNQNSILCHSMGNRLLEGITTELNHQAQIEMIILAAPDLEINSFQNGELLNKFKLREIVILVNKKDHLLRLSKLIHEEKRLGLNGEEGMVFSKIKDKTKVTVWDVTKQVKEGKFGSGHVYFKRTETIFNRIKDKLEN